MQASLRWLLPLIEAFDWVDCFVIFGLFGLSLFLISLFE